MDIEPCNPSNTRNALADAEIAGLRAPASRYHHQHDYAAAIVQIFIYLLILHCISVNLTGTGLTVWPSELFQLPLPHIQTRRQAWQDWFRQMGLEPSAPPNSAQSMISSIRSVGLYFMGWVLHCCQTI